MAKTTVAIECGSCAKLIERVPGVKKVVVTGPKGNEIATVEFDETKVSESKIKQTVKK